MSNQQHASEQGGPSAESDERPAVRQELAEQLSDFARRLESEDEPAEVLDEVVRAAVHLIPGTDEASISVVTGRRAVESRHPTGALPQKVDALQMETGQGPCLDACYEQQTVRVPNLTTEDRWPDFSARAVELGVHSMLSFQLYVEGDNLGALNLYSRSADGFTDESEQVGLVFASHAAIAFAGADKVHNLRIAVERRDLIGQAKGILMERHKITARQAFAILVRVSQDNNRKLFDVAEELTATGSLTR